MSTNLDDGFFRKRRLPHWEVEDRPYFVTACLQGSISAAGRTAIREYRNKLEKNPRPEDLTPAEWEYRKDKLAFAFTDRLLDSNPPVNHLADDRLAEVVEKGVIHFAGERYSLSAWCVMPSHLHWVFRPLQSWWTGYSKVQEAAGKKRRTPREAIMQSLLSFTGRVCNQLLQCDGRFWQVESWDHWVRDEGELVRIVKYIEENPVNAGLVPEPAVWKWSSAQVRMRHGLKMDEEVRKEHFMDSGA